VSEIGLQASLFDGGKPEVDGGFAGLRRIALDERSWVDHAPGWLLGSDELFTELHRAIQPAHRPRLGPDRPGAPADRRLVDRGDLRRRAPSPA
jgi:hypothetical protein